MKKSLTILLSLLMAMFLLSAINATGDELENKLKQELPMLLGTNNAGTTFYLTFHPCWEETGPNNALRIYVSAAVATPVTLEIEGIGKKVTQVTIPNDIIEFRLSPVEGQMYSKGNGGLPIPPQPSQVWAKRAVKITSEEPIIVYGVTRYQYTSDGFLAVPITGLGKEYQVASYTDPTTNQSQYLPSYTSIIAIYDNTTVTFKLGGYESSRALLLQNDTLKFGKQLKERMFAGDVWLIAGIGAFNDLSGSTIKASKPVAVISGNFCAYIPAWNSACDFIIEQELPQNVWGTKYHVTPIIERKNNSLIKVYAKEPFTNLFRDGQPIGQILTPGGLFGTGFLEMRSDPDIPKRPVIISGDKAINIVQYNPGMSEDNVESDPFQLGLTPIEQYQSEIVFNTPGIRGGFGFRKNYINFVYKATPDGAIPDDIDVAEVLGGTVMWEPMNTKFPNPGEIFQDEPEADGRRWMSKTIKIDRDGVYRIRTKSKTDKFAAYAYGFDSWDSYGFPTSVALADLEIPDTLAPVMEYTMGCDGNVTKGLVIDEPRDNIDNRSNLGLVMMDYRDSENYSFDNEPFVIGETMQTNWSLTVIDPSLQGRAHLVFQDRVGNRTDSIIMYYPAKAIVRTKDKKFRQNFGSFKLETPAKEAIFDFEVYNDGKSTIPAGYKMFLKQDSKLLEPEKTNDLFGETNFEILGLNGVNLTPMQPGESRKFQIKFTATTEGYFYDEIGVVIMNETNDTCWNQYTLKIEASVGVPKIAADDHNFMEVTVGTTMQKVLSVRNNKSDGSSTTLKIIGVQYSDQQMIDDGIYVIPEFANISPDNPVTVAIDASFNFNVSFTPKAVKIYPLEITFIADSDVPDPITILSGLGIQPNLKANSEEWPKLRVDYKNYYTDNQAGNRNLPAANNIPPYASSNPQPFGVQAITLMNGGTKEVTLKEPIIDVAETVNGGNFLVTYNGNKVPLNDPTLLTSDFLKGKKIAGNNGQLIIPVEFHPITPGPSKLVMRYPSDAADQDVTTILEGYGIYPIASAIGINFDLLHDNFVGAPPVVSKVIFANDKWEHEDVLVIKNFVANGPIAKVPGKNIFTYDDTKITKVLVDKTEVLNQTLPISLLPGESIEVPVTYEPTAAQTYNASLTTVSDAATEVTAPISGSADIYAATTTTDQVTICQNDTYDLLPKFINNSSVPVTIESVTLDVTSLPTPSNPNDFVIDANVAKSIVAANGGEQVVKITFKPSTIYNNAKIKFNIVTDAKNASKNQVIEVTVSSTFDIVNIYSDFSVKEVDAGKPEATTLVVKVKDAKTFNLADQASYTFELEYENKFIDIEKKGNDVSKLTARIKPGAIFAGYTIQNVSKQIVPNATDRALITFEFKGTAPVKNFPKDAELFSILFDSYLPYYNATTGTFKEPNAEAFVRKISVPSNEFCLGFGTTTTEVGLKPVCVDSIRQIILTGTNFGLMAINPNPVTSQGGEISFSVGLNNSATEINIYNLSGELVATPLSSTLNVGEYSVRIPVEMLGSGVYIYELKSAHFTDRKQMVITK